MSFERDPECHARWQRIAAHALGGDDARFLSRVERANAWTPEEAREAVEEYRRFVFLACLGEEVTPSKAVDAVWHEHLVHTRDYWLDFCPHALGMPLHHTPGGQPRDEARFAAQYQRTLQRYEQWFGTPPPRWWPRRKPVVESDEAAATASAPRAAIAAMAGSRRAVPAALGLAAIPAFALAAARPANPLDWTGPEFLALYVVLLAALSLAGFVLRTILQGTAAPPVASGRLGVLDTAYLAGGAGRCVDAAVAELHQRGALHWNGQTRRFEKRDTRQPLDPQLQSAADALASSIDTGTTWATRIRADLERRGLWQRAADLRRIGLWSASPLLLLLGFGLAKIAIGLQRDRPVSGLVVLCVITAVLVLVLVFKRPGPTRAGRVALDRRRTEYRGSGQGRRDLGLAVALGGTALLADTALAGYHDLRRPANDSSSSSDSSSGSSSDSGDSGGGSSCGGCGGGGGD